MSAKLWLVLTGFCNICMQLHCGYASNPHSWTSSNETKRTEMHLGSPNMALHEHKAAASNEMYLRFCLFMLDLKTTHSRKHSCCTTSCCTRGVAVAVRAINGTVGYLKQQACYVACSRQDCLYKSYIWAFLGKRCLEWCHLMSLNTVICAHVCVHQLSQYHNVWKHDLLQNRQSPMERLWLHFCMETKACSSRLMQSACMSSSSLLSVDGRRQHECWAGYWAMPLPGRTTARCMLNGILNKTPLQRLT